MIFSFFTFFLEKYLSIRKEIAHDKEIKANKNKSSIFFLSFLNQRM
jgi:hypothetical protein